MKGDYIIFTYFLANYFVPGISGLLEEGHKAVMVDGHAQWGVRYPTLMMVCVGNASSSGLFLNFPGAYGGLILRL